MHGKELLACMRFEHTTTFRLTFKHCWVLYSVGIDAVLLCNATVFLDGIVSCVLRALAGEFKSPDKIVPNLILERHGHLTQVMQKAICQLNLSNLCLLHARMASLHLPYSQQKDALSKHQQQQQQPYLVIWTI